MLIKRYQIVTTVVTSSSIVIFYFGDWCQFKKKLHWISGADKCKCSPKRSLCDTSPIIDKTAHLVVVSENTCLTTYYNLIFILWLVCRWGRTTQSPSLGRFGRHDWHAIPLHRICGLVHQTPSWQWRRCFSTITMSDTKQEHKRREVKDGDTPFHAYLGLSFCRTDQKEAPGRRNATWIRLEHWIMTGY